MPKQINYADPNGATTIGASLQFVRTAVGATGVQVAYNPANGDAPIESNIGVALDAAGRTALNTVITQLDAFYKLQKAYT